MSTKNPTSSRTKISKRNKKVKADVEKMVLTPPVCSVNDVHQGQRKDPPTFHPSLWGDFFLTYQPPTAPKVTSE
jgi:hypothetical protein